MKPQSCDATTLAPSKIFMHDESRTICKQRPKIRIIHIVSPEIIRTDVEHFKELVQRLTGKPEERKRSSNKGNNVTSQMPPPNSNISKPRKHIGSSDATLSQSATNRTKKESEKIYGVENHHNSYLSYLGDVDEFIHDMNSFPLVPFRASQNNTFGDISLC